MIPVAHFIPHWLSRTEGWIYTQLRNLPAADVQSTVLCSHRVDDSKFFSCDSVTAFAETSRLTFGMAALIRKTGLRQYYPHLKVALERQRVAILHSHFGDAAWRNARAAQSAGVFHVTTFYGVDGTMLPHTHRQWHRRYRDLFDHADRVLCEGPAFAGELTKLGCDPARLIVHPLGMELDLLPFNPVRWDRREPVRFLIAGRFVPKKGFCDAIAAIGTLARHIPVSVTLVGGATSAPASRAEASAIETAIVREKLEGRTRRLGWLSPEQLREETAKHHFFMAPSVRADNGDTEGGAPVTANEAQALGVPVIGTAHCDIPFVLDQGTTLSAEHDPAGLVRQVEDWLNCLDWTSRLARGRHRVETRYDAVRQGERLAQIYREVISG